MNNLAELYRAQGRYEEAELFQKRAILIDEEALGQDHPALATDLNNLGLIYHDQVATPKPSRTTDVRWRSRKRRWGRSIPT